MKNDFLRDIHILIIITCEYYLAIAKNKNKKIPKKQKQKTQTF